MLCSSSASAVELQLQNRPGQISAGTFPGCREPEISRMSNARTIARNTGWYGLETAVAAVVTVITSIAIARVLGPSKMGYIIYVSWIASVISNLAGIGIPETTRKYMAEFLGRADRGTARYIFLRAMLFQGGVATIATCVLLFWVLRDAEASYRLSASLVVLSVWPSMMNSISAQANVAAEELAANLPASVISSFTFLIAASATVYFRWGILGVGIAILSMRVVDFVVRLYPTMKRILSWESSDPQLAGLSARMISFAFQSLASLVLALIVWEKSEFFLLKHLCSDIRQIAFYSVAVSMADRLMTGSTVFGSASGATIFAQYGRDKSKLPAIASSTFRYLALSSIPLHFIAAALAAPALTFVYGRQYVEASAVVTLAPLLCLPKAFISPIQNMLQSTERQTYVIAATMLAGLVDIAVASSLIPAHGAVGACIGSGAAQTFAAGVMWAIGVYLFRMRLPWIQLAKIGIISTLAAVLAHVIAGRMSPPWGILCGASASLVVLLGLFLLLRVMETEDQVRFAALSKLLPRPICGPVRRVMSWMIRPSLSDMSTPGIG